MAIVYARAQDAVASTAADPASASFGFAVTEGNLLVVTGTERSGGSAANFTISDNGSNAGWTKRVSETTLQGDGSARRTHVVWSKVADATDAAQSPYTVTVDDGSASSKRIQIEEFTAGATATWAFEDVAVANTGTGSTSPLASGDTASVSGILLLLGSAIWRNGTGNPGTPAFSGLGGTVVAEGGTNGSTLASAWAQDETTGAKSTELSWTGSGHEANVALLVFSAVEPGGATNLDGTDTTQAQSATSPALTQTHELAADSATQAQSATAAALTQVHELQPVSAVQGQNATAAALEQTHELAATDAVQAQTADTAAAVEGVTLSPASTVQGQSAGSAALTQVHALAAVNALQAQTADAAVLTQLYEMVAASAVQGQIVVLPTLTLGELTTPASRIFPVQPEDRTFSVLAEDRTFEIAAESRRFAVT